MTASALWRSVQKVDAISSRDLVSEVLRKSLNIKCYEKGLQFCPETKLIYFPEGLVEGDNLKFTRPDGSKSHVGTVGQRKFPRPKAEEEYYKYYLAPSFSIDQNLFDDFVVLLRIRVRISTVDGKAITKRAANSRRKHLCKGWWNYEWLNRMLAISSYLADDGQIVIGDTQGEQIIIDSQPLTLNAPKGINDEAVKKFKKELSETLQESEEEIPDEDEEEEVLETDE